MRGQIGRADVVVAPAGAFDAILTPGAVEAVRSVDGVDAVVPHVGMRTTVVVADGARSATDPRDRIAFVRGVEPAEYRRLHELRVEEGRDPAPAAAEFAVPRALADRFGFVLGDAATVVAPAGRVSGTVVGILADAGAATALQGNVLFTSTATARGFLGIAEGSFTGLDVGLADGVVTETWIAEHRAELRGVSVSAAADVAAGFRTFIEGINAALTLVAAIAVFVGGFLVFLTFSVAVAERTRVLGTLRALGAVQRRVARVVVAEAAILGAACALVGLAIGYILASAAIGLVGNLLDLELGRTGFPIGEALVSGGLGVVVSIAAAWVPARRASRIDPVVAMRGGALAIERPPLRWVGPLLATAGVAIAVLSGGNTVLGAVGALTVLGGAVLSVPLAIAPLGRLAGRAIDRFAPGPGAIAARHLDRERSRSAYTLALVMVVLAAVLAVGASNLALGSSLDTILERQAGAIQVSAPGAVDDAALAAIGGVPGVEVVSPVRYGNTDLVVPSTDAGGEPARSSSFLQIIDPATYFEVSSFPYTTGDDATVRAALEKGSAVVVPAPEANRLGIDVGDDIELVTVDGPAPFRVVGIYAVLGGGFGTVVGTADLPRFGAGRVNGALVGTGDADVDAVAEAIRSRIGGDRQLSVDTPADARRYAQAQLDGFFSLAYAMLVLTAVISMLGLANTLVVAVIARTREIGVLRSYGARRRQIRRMVTVEAIIMVGIALVLALPVTAVLGLGIVNGQRATLGASIDYRFPFALVAPVAVAAVVLAGLAAAVPARRAARLAIVDTLRFD